MLIHPAARGRDTPIHFVVIADTIFRENTAETHPKDGDSGIRWGGASQTLLLLRLGRANSDAHKNLHLPKQGQHGALAWLSNPTTQIGYRWLVIGLFDNRLPNFLLLKTG